MRDFRPDEVPAHLLSYFEEVMPNEDGKGYIAHPTLTVKPQNLMNWLVKLAMRPGGVVLDPFAGTCTTGRAAMLEGMNAILIEREAVYCQLGVQRLSKPVQQALFPDLA